MTNLEIIQAEVNAFNKVQAEKGEQKIFALVDTEQDCCMNSRVPGGSFILSFIKVRLETSTHWRLPIGVWCTTNPSNRAIEIQNEIRMALKEGLAKLP